MGRDRICADDNKNSFGDPALPPSLIALQIEPSQALALQRQKDPMAVTFSGVLLHAHQGNRML